MDNTSKFFSIIIPVYNSGRYVSDAIESMVHQRYDFYSNVEVIIVDDGSTDNSQQFCEAIAAQYPDNVRFIQQAHAGVGVARNRGIAHARGEWIGLLDPDDRYSKGTLKKVYKAIRNWQDIKLVAIPMYTFEREHKAHRLNYKFEQTSLIDIQDQPEAIQLSSASTFVQRSVFESHHFPEATIVGEDMIFNNRIISRIRQFGLVADAKYYYRKRADHSSVMDDIENQAIRYLPYVQHAILDEIPGLLEDGQLPEYFQNVYLYELSGKIKTLQRPEPLIDDDQFNTYLTLLAKVCQYIDDETIMNSRFLDAHRKYELIAFKRDGKIADFYSLFTNKISEDKRDVLIMDDSQQVVRKLSSLGLRVTNFKRIGDSMLIMGFFDTYYSVEKADVYFENSVKEQIAVQLIPDVRDNCFFLGEQFKHISKLHFKVPLDFFDKKVYLIIKDSDTGIAKKVALDFVGRKTRMIKGIAGSRMVLGQSYLYYDKALKSLLVTHDAETKTRLDLEANLALSDRVDVDQPWAIQDIRAIAELWQKQYAHRVINLFMDRESKADDNAEAMIKYYQTQSLPDTENYFVVDKDSPDFLRLRELGIKVLEYGSLKHLKLLLVATNLIVSQAAWATVDPFSTFYHDALKDLFKFNLIFLQHGVILADVSRVLKKSKVGMDLFVTSAYPENAEIRSDRYEYDPNEVILTGLPRHDYLNLTKGKYIAVMPTWSREVVSDAKQNDLREGISDFDQTDYYKKWNGLLNNQELIDAAKSRGYQLIFVPHPELRNSVNNFQLDQVELASYDTRYVDIINQSACIITDRSSVFMDFAYAKKEVFYYRPDDNNNYDNGYFDFERDGFGPVCDTQADLVSKVVQGLSTDFELDELYLKRRNAFFAFDDQRNCERVFNQIQALTSQSTLRVQDQKQENKQKTNRLTRVLRKVIKRGRRLTK